MASSRSLRFAARSRVPRDRFLSPATTYTVTNTGISGRERCAKRS
jgi:hypothetical protein